MADARKRTAAKQPVRKKARANPFKIARRLQKKRR